MKNLARILLGASSVVLASGGLLHAIAFDSMANIAGASNLPEFFLGSLKALWLIDSATMIILAIAFALAAMRPVAGHPGIIALLATVPAATAALLLLFIGLFPPAHVPLLASAAMAGLASVLLALSSKRGD